MPDLTGLPALDVAIGLAFLFFVLSTACSAINETIANLLGWRAKTLEDAIRAMVDDPKMEKGAREWFGGVKKVRPKDEPPAAGAAAAAADVPADLTTSVLSHWRIKALVRNADSTVRRRKYPSYLPPKALSLAIAETLAKGSAGTTPVARQEDPAIFAQLQTTLESLPAGQTRDVLQKALANARGTLAGFRRQLEVAFDDGMERASGWYKRKAQAVIVVLAVVVTVGLNVDSVHIADRLWRDDALRTTVTARAVDAQGGKAASLQDAADDVEDVKQLGFPLGWGDDNEPTQWKDGIARIPGWLITIAALSLGAPFWFDVLSRLARLRGSGAPKEPRTLSDGAGAG